MTEQEYRLDNLVRKQRGFSRAYAQEAIENGFVSVNGKIITKPGMKCQENADIVITVDNMKYVGRGGFKLERALTHFAISVQNAVCGDIGASTGGFTDCLLQHGAKKIYAIDVGSNQLAAILQQDERVISIENQNIRALDKLPEKLDFVTIDVSFISLSKVIGHIAPLLHENGAMVALIKPQFEAGQAFLNKKGVVTQPKIHIKIIKQVAAAMESCGFRVINTTPSPIQGQQGNTEYLIYAKKVPLLTP